jgi:hypothetical protein
VFRLMLSDQELGTSRLEGLDDGMAMAHGTFVPSTGYTAVASLFRRMSDAMEARSDLAELFAARDALDLRLLGPKGVSVPTECVMVYDYGDDLDREIHVKVTDVALWRRAQEAG